MSKRSRKEDVPFSAASTPTQRMISRKRISSGQNVVSSPIALPSPQPLTSIQVDELQTYRGIARRPSVARSLDFSSCEPAATTENYNQGTLWKEHEVKQLIRYVGLNGFEDKWPMYKNGHYFWSGASDFLQSQIPLCSRSASSCRNKLQKSLMHQFATPRVALAHYFPDGLVAQLPGSYESIDINELVVKTSQVLSSADPRDEIQFISRLFEKHALSVYGVLAPRDFLALSLMAMKELNDAGRSNVLYGLAKIIGTKRPDSEEPLLPLSRMPMGFLEHCINFFSSSRFENVPHCPNDYREWLSSMFSLFGTKWVKLFCGPMWRIESGDATLRNVRDPLKAHVNVPGLSERQLERDIAGSQISTGPEIQVKMLDTAHRANPHCNWWLKGDGCDLVSGLGESMRLQWSGDVDLNSGDLQQVYKKYRDTLDFVSNLNVADDNFLGHLKECSLLLVQEKKFLIEALREAEKVYHEKTVEGKCSSNDLFSAGWTVEELQKLITDQQEILVNVSTLQDQIEADSDYASTSAAAQRLLNIRQKLTGFIRSLYRHKRTPATHVYVMMISSEQRQVKPYAIPIQLIPYKSIDEGLMRSFVCAVLKAMVSRGMKVVGFCSNGEFNSMRSHGYTRAISVFKIRSKVRAKYARLGKSAMLAMITPKLQGNLLNAEKPNSVVPPSMLCEVLIWQAIQSLSWEDIISRLRSRTVPTGYTYHAWKAGQAIEKEEMVDKLRSILAQLEFSQIIRDYDEKGVPFRTHLHVPEIHPDTGYMWYEREDPAHILKRIARCTREGGPDRIKLERFVEAIKDSTTGLTYHVLVGIRKQSVQDAERMFSQALADFMDCKGYTEEAKYIRAVNGWRRAVDQRGLSSLQRCQLNYNFLNYILDELIPWHSSNYDFSTLEVNKSTSGICGFTRQVLIAIVAQIETTEFRRIELLNEGLLPENPRASTTDDVECFFSVTRDLVGKNFTLKQVQIGWRKICLEFDKRTNPELPFYYYTSHHDRFYEGERPSFDAQPTKQKTKRLPVVESSVVFKSGRATISP